MNHSMVINQQHGTILHPPFLLYSKGSCTLYGCSSRRVSLHILMCKLQFPCVSLQFPCVSLQKRIPTERCTIFVQDQFMCKSPFSMCKSPFSMCKSPFSVVLLSLHNVLWPACVQISRRPRSYITTPAFICHDARVQLSRRPRANVCPSLLLLSHLTQRKNQQKRSAEAGQPCE